MRGPQQTASSSLPAEIELGPQIGRGKRSNVYRASMCGRQVALKLYFPEIVAKYRRRHGVSTARFEYNRNAAFYAVDGLRRFVAEPLRVLGDDDGYSVAFVQELITGESLRDIARQRGGIPPETLRAMRRIVELAGTAGLFDVDLSPTNMAVRRGDEGWMPILFDFNMVPQHQRAPNPFVALLYRTGLRHPAHRDRLMLKKLETWKG